MVYLVTWDLNKEGTVAYSQARTRLLEAINKFDNTYNSLLDSVRFISTNRTANDLYIYLQRQGGLDDNDTIVVVRMYGKQDNSSNDGNLGEATWSWINARI